MSTAKWITLACILLATPVVISGYAQSAQFFTALALACAGVFWCAALFRSWSWPNHFLLVLFICAAVYGAWKGYPPFLMLLGILAALSAWDLNHMLLRFAQVKPAALMPGLVRRHLLRLAAVIGLGLLLGGAALAIHLHLSFILAVILGLAIFIALSQVVIFLRRGGS